MSSIANTVLTIVSRLPMPMMQCIAKGIAAIANTFKLSKTAEVVRLNMKIAFDGKYTEQQQNQMINEAIRHEIMSYFEFFHIWGADTDTNIQRIHQVNGAEHFHAALAEKKGVVLIVPHFGTWEIMNAWCAQFTQMTILYKPVKNEVADAFVRQARSREQSHLVPTNETGVREVFKALKQGGTTVILPDHSPQIESDLVDYFGIPLYSSNLSAKLIQKTKAKALFLYAIRDDKQGFVMNIEPFDEAIYQGTANDATRLIHQKIEQLIHQYPTHYHWSYKRFKANPALDGIYHQDMAVSLRQIKELRTQHATD